MEKEEKKVANNEEIFRKKSLDRAKSPESLDDYIHVSNPGVWLILISVIVLLIGVFVWGIFGQIDSSVPAKVRVEDDNIICYIEEEYISSVTEGMTVKFNSVTATIESIDEKEDKRYICILKTDASIDSGFYDGKIITKSYKPLSFILN